MTQFTQMTLTIVSCPITSMGKTVLAVAADNSLLSGLSVWKPEISDDVVGASSCPSIINGSLITYIKLQTKTWYLNSQGYLKFETFLCPRK